VGTGWPNTHANTFEDTCTKKDKNKKIRENKKTRIKKEKEKRKEQEKGRGKKHEKKRGTKRGKRNMGGDWFSGVEERGY